LSVNTFSIVIPAQAGIHRRHLDTTVVMDASHGFPPARE
jgi:hypothetical protein